MSEPTLESYARALAQAARRTGRQLAISSGRQRDEAIRVIADELRASTDSIVAENARDLASGEKMGLTSAMLERLKLDEERIAKMAKAVIEVADQPDPVGETIEAQVRPNGIRVEKRRVPIGSVMIVYESRPNVTSDAAALCIKSGNACILRGGKESIYSNLAIGKAVARGLEKAGLPSESVQVVSKTDRELVQMLLAQDQDIDLVIPRGGESLIRAVVEHSRIPVIKHYTGNCHVYVHEDCPQELAESIIVNAKCQRPAVCNAAESLLIHAQCAQRVLPGIVAKLIQAGVEIRGCERTRQIVPQVKAAGEEDYVAEYLELIISCKVVDSLQDAIEHINRYSSHHTDAILTHDVRAADAFVAGVDSANVMVNVSTRFSDGGEYGLGAEIGISTDKLHARGPMGAGRFNDVQVGRQGLRAGTTVEMPVMFQFFALNALLLMANPSTQPARQVRIALCQVLCIDGDRNGNFQRITNALEQAVKDKADIACFPESIILGWENPDAHKNAASIPGKDSKRIGDLAKQFNMMIAIGLDEKNGDQLYDSAILVDRDGTILLKHRKINVLPELMDPPYSTGKSEDIAAVDTRFGRIGILVCADTFTKDHLERMAKLKPDLVLVPYGWAAKNKEWPAHAKLLEELVDKIAAQWACPVIGTNLVGAISQGPWHGRTYGGASVAADADGKTLTVLKDRDVEVRTITVQLRK